MWRSQFGETVGELAVERLEVGTQRLRARGEVGGVVGVDLGQRGGHGVAEGRHPERVEPEVRVEAAVDALLVVVTVVRCVVVVGHVHEGLEADDRRGVEHVTAGVLVDRVVDRRLQAALVHDEVGLGDQGRLLDRRLEVVRLLAGRRQVVDRDDVTADPVGDELERVERGRDLDAAAGVVGEGAAAAGDEERRSRARATSRYGDS